MSAWGRGSFLFLINLGDQGGVHSFGRSNCGCGQELFNSLWLNRRVNALLLVGLSSSEGGRLGCIGLTIPNISCLTYSVGERVYILSRKILLLYAGGHGVGAWGFGEDTEIFGGLGEK
jgi:hypothetical protein